MRLTTLADLIEKVKIEGRLSSNPARGLDSTEYISQIVNRTYELLWDDYEWEHLNIKHTDGFVQLQAGQNIYNFPSKIDLSTVTGAWASSGNIWSPLEYGIDLSNYSMIDPTTNNRSDPAQRWEARSLDTFEVYPLPASNNERIGFNSKLKYAPLVNPTDVAQIDSLCIVLMCAAEILANSNAKDASVKMDLAQKRIAKMKGNVSSKRRFRMGLSDSNSPAPRQLLVAYARR